MINDSTQKTLVCLLDLRPRTSLRAESREPRARESISSLGTSKGLLEVAKFAIYVTVPVALTYAFVTDSGTLHKLMGFVYISAPLSISCNFHFLSSLLLLHIAIYISKFSMGMMIRLDRHCCTPQVEQRLGLRL
ncbi:hypothetical protein KSP39_PZI019648 [Platanthera zijinensis]|uniref:Uncharacterized protein n=1 Tax=Platanthera zijinensis TaxID=2320716 RepID=A0AAP0B2A5_9ASPA